MATTEIYTLSLHDALPICRLLRLRHVLAVHLADRLRRGLRRARHVPDRHPAAQHVRDGGDRKSTRLNSSHANISYAVFCLKKHIYSILLLWQRSEEHTSVL